MPAKIIRFDVELKSVNPKRNFTRPKVFTNDLNSVDIQFNVTDMKEDELATSSATTLLYMRDGSFFQNPSTDVSRVGNVFTYQLKENEGNHKGVAQIQLVVTIPGTPDKEFASQLYEFEIDNGLETKVAQEVMIYDWTTLTRDARAYIDQFVADELLREAEFENNEFDRNATFVDSQEQRNTDFIASQNARSLEYNGQSDSLDLLLADAQANIQAFDVALQEGIIATNIAAELDNLESTYAPRLLSAEQQLAETATKDEVALKRDKSTKIQLNDFSDDAIDAIAGTSPVIGYVENHSLDVKKVNWWEVTNENLLNPASKITGYINGDGTLNTSVGNLFEYLKVEPGETYITAGTIYDSGYYDADMVFVSMHPKTATFTVPAGVERLSISYASWDESIMLVKGSVYPSEIIPYGVYDLNIVDQNYKNMLDKQIKEYNAGDSGVFLEKRINLLDQTKMVDGYIGGDGSIVYNASCKVSDFIPVEEGKTYLTTASWDSGYYGANENFIQQSVGAGGNFTVPAALGIKYLRVAIPTSALASDTMLVCTNEYAYDAGFVPYADYWLDYNFPNNRLSRIYSKLRGLKWNNIGDSIANSTTGYKILIPSQTGIVLTNYAVDGASYAPKTGQTMVISEAYTNMINDADIITVHAGVNDAAGGIAIGTMADRTNATFMGALHVTFAGLIKKYLGKKIGVMTPIQRADNGALIPYVEAIKEVAAFYSIPCLDLNARCGLHPDIAEIKAAYYDEIGLHPNQAGHRVFTPRIIDFLESL